MPNAALLVIAKQPVAGRAKTRLTPPCTPEQAATLADAALRDTLETVGEGAGRGATCSSSKAIPSRGAPTDSR